MIPTETRDGHHPGSPPAAGAPVPCAEEYLVQRGPERYGPYPRETFLQYARSGHFAAGDVAWHQGMSLWEPVATVMARLEGRSPPTGKASDDGLKYIVPIGASGFAIAASWVGVFSLFTLAPAPIAIGLGILALRDVQKHPTKSGKGRAWFGIISGSFAIGFLIFLFARF